MRILIVDDSAPTRRFIQRVAELTGLPFHFYAEASNGAEALDQMASDDFDLVLIDVNMPVMNGEEFLRALRAKPGYEHVPVVAISTDATVDRISRMRSLGANGYITKPFTPEALRDQLERVLRTGGHHIEEPASTAGGSVEELLRVSARHVLETMFFSSVEGELPPQSVDHGLSAWITFSGSISGRFALVLSPDAASNVANNFLGLTGAAVDATEEGQVVRELANMVCGRFLSRFAPDGHFDLGPGLALPGDSFVAFAQQLSGNEPAAQAAIRLDVGQANMILSLESGATCQFRQGMSVAGSGLGVTHSAERLSG
jgi:two-component system, chemotaxis family, chemotaxis protein CheY